MVNLSDDIDEVGRQLRTMRSARVVSRRIYQWNELNAEELGTILLDDYLIIYPNSTERYCVFLFETHLLCCEESFDGRQLEYADKYPIRSWELGPALRRTTPLHLVYTIPTDRITTVRCPFTGVHIITT